MSVGPGVYARSLMVMSLLLPWDDFTFYYRDGTRPEDPVNRYADLLIEAAGRSGKR